ncbi:MAG: hypothetical protein U0401_09345 [Anaerolineae bacterium]
MTANLARKAREIKKIVLCYEGSLPARWLIGVGSLKGKLERAGVEVGGSTLLFNLRHGKGGRTEVSRLGVDIINAPIQQLPPDADIILTVKELAPRAQANVPGAWVIPVSHFFRTPIYDEIVARLVESHGGANGG